MWSVSLQFCFIWGNVPANQQILRTHLIPTSHFADGEVKSSQGGGVIRLEPKLRPVTSSQNLIHAANTGTGAPWAGPGAPAGLTFPLGSETKLHFSDGTDYRSSLLGPHSRGRNVSISSESCRTMAYRTGTCPHPDGLSLQAVAQFPGDMPSCTGAVWARALCTHLCSPHSAVACVWTAL